MHRFRDCVDELSDLLYYIQDIYALNLGELAVAMSSNLLDKLAHFVEALSPSDAGPLQPGVALYVLGQLFFVLREPRLVHALAALLLAAPARPPLPPLLAQPVLALPAAFLLLCVARSAAAPALLGAALTRQSSLLQAILAEPGGPTAAAAVAASGPEGEQGEQSEGLVAEALLKMLALPDAPVLAVQCAVLLLRALQIAPKTLPPGESCCRVVVLFSHHLTQCRALRGRGRSACGAAGHRSRSLAGGKSREAVAFCFSFFFFCPSVSSAA